MANWILSDSLPLALAVPVSASASGMPGRLGLMATATSTNTMSTASTSGGDGDGKPPSRPVSLSPIPGSASKWSVSNAEQLNIVYVPLDKSPYLYRVPENDDHGMDGDYYEYDYKHLLQDAVKRNKRDGVSVWHYFERSLLSHTVPGAGQHPEHSVAQSRPVLDTILHLLEPDVSDEESLQLLNFFSSKKADLQDDDMVEVNDDESTTSSCHGSGSGSCESSPPRPKHATVASGMLAPCDASSTTREISPEKVPRAHGVVAETSVLPEAECEKKAKNLLNNLRHKICLRMLGLKVDRMTKAELYQLFTISPDEATSFVAEKFASLEMKKAVRRYLEVLKTVLCRYAVGDPTGESCFVILFQSFAQAFFLDFWSAVEKRTLTIYGQQIASIPDLRFEVESGDASVVVSVVEVRNLAQEIETAVLRLGCQVGGVHKLIHDIELPFNVRGQHAAELLVELPYTKLPKSDDGYEFIFGFIVQCTRVRLTCLKMLKRHRELLGENQPQDLKDMRAEIHYSRGYDILKKDDRKHLGYILLFMAFLCDREVFFS